MWFLVHSSLVYVVPSLWILSSKVLPLYLIIILSWKLNNNNCIISEMEYSLFGDNFRGTGRVCRVPRRQRYILYGSTILCILSKYNIIKI